MIMAERKKHILLIATINEPCTNTTVNEDNISITCRGVILDKQSNKIISVSDYSFAEDFRQVDTQPYLTHISSFKIKNVQNFAVLNQIKMNNSQEHKMLGGKSRILSLLSKKIQMNTILLDILSQGFNPLYFGLGSIYTIFLKIS